MLGLRKIREKVKGKSGKENQDAASTLKTWLEECAPSRAFDLPLTLNLSAFTLLYNPASNAVAAASIRSSAQSHSSLVIVNGGVIIEQLNLPKL